MKVLQEFFDLNVEKGDILIVYERDAQAIVNRLINILGKNINIISNEGIIIASGDKKRIGHTHEAGRIAAAEKREVIVDSENIVDYPGAKIGVNIPVCHKEVVICVVGITGDISETKGYALIVKELVELLFQELENKHFEYLKGRALRSFAREILKEHDMEGIHSIVQRANIMGFDFNIERNVIVIDVDDFASQRGPYKEFTEIMLQNLKQQINDMLDSMLDPYEIAFNICDNKFAVLKHCDGKVMEFALSCKKMLESKFNVDCNIGIGCVCSSCKEYSKSYRLADRAISIGHKVEAAKKIYSWNDYKFQILLSSANEELKKDYIKEYNQIFKNLDDDDDSIETIKIYYENGMNIKNTASAMFIHRNTVLYRLNKFKQKHNMDVFNVNDCMNLYIAIMLHKL